MDIPFFKPGSFINEANATPQQVAQKRALLAAMMPRFGSAKYVGEGIGQLATGVLMGKRNRQLDRAEETGRKSAEDMFGRLFGTANSATSPDVTGPLSVLGIAPQPVEADPNSPAALGDDTMAALGKPPVRTAADPESIKAGLVARGLPEHVAEGFVMNFQDESGLNPGINEIAPLVPGSRGGFGLYQLTGPRRRAYEAFAAERGVPFDDVDAQLDFLMTELQGPEARAAEAILSTKDAGQAGAAIVNEFLRPAEEHRAKRAARYAGGGYVPPSGADFGGAEQSGIPLAELQAAMANPWLMSDPAMAGVIQAEYARQSQMNDPMYQMQIEEQRLRLAEMQNPEAAAPEAFTERMFTLNALGIDPQSEEGRAYLMTGQLPEAEGANLPAGFQSLDMQARAAGFEPGTPEYQEFMANGGGSGTPAAFTALDMQARAAGFEPGTPEYQEFMATRGAGLAAAATEKGRAQAEAEIAAPGDVASADVTLGYIDSIKNHPGRKAGTGGSAWLGNIPGTTAREFQIEVERLKAGAFLTAIEQLRGMGALSNAEGQTATAAVAALDLYGDEEGFLKRLAEYEAIVKRGRERAAKRIKVEEDAAPATEKADAGAPPEGVSAEDWKYMTPEERALFQ